MVRNNGNSNVTPGVNVIDGMVAGLVATIASALFIVVATLMALLPVDFNIVMIHGSLFGFASGIVSAWIVYFIIGILWGVLYAYTQHRIRASTSCRKGIMFGIFIWLIVMLVMMPLADAGVFVSKYGVTAMLFTLVLDLLFGGVLGCTYQKLWEDRVNKRSA